MAYDSPTASQIRQNSEQRYAQSRNRLMGLLSQRQQYANELAAEHEAMLAEQEHEIQEQQNEGSRNWLHGATTGAMAGSPFGVVGSAIGGGIGLIGGLQASYNNRQEQNKGEGKWSSFGKALTHPMGDKFDAAGDIPMAQLAGLGMAYGGQPSPAKDGMATAEASQAQGLADWRKAEEAARNSRASAGMAKTGGNVAPDTFGATGSDMSAPFSAPKPPPSY